MVQVADFAGRPDRTLWPLESVHISCGIRQLWLFSGQNEANPEQELVSCFTAIHRANPNNGEMGRHRCAFYVFSDKYNYSTWVNNKLGEVEFTKKETAHHGKHLAEYIVKEGLGEVIASPQAINPNTGNTIQAWFWKVDHKALTAWCAARGIKNYNDEPVTEAAARGAHE